MNNDLILVDKLLVLSTLAVFLFSILTLKVEVRWLASTGGVICEISCPFEENLLLERWWSDKILLPWLLWFF